MFTIHYGVIQKDPDAMARGPEQRDIEDLVGGSQLLSNGDSFLVWGEPMDHTLHIQRIGVRWSPATVKGFVNHEFPYDAETDDRRALRERISRDRIALYERMPSHLRLVDYVFVTPEDDWSAEPSAIWTLEEALS